MSSSDQGHDLALDLHIKIGFLGLSLSYYWIRLGPPFIRPLFKYLFFGGLCWLFMANSLS